MKDQEKINKQILIAETELAALDAKRAALQNRIRQLNELKQTIADEQFPRARLSVPKVTNESPQEHKIALFTLRGGLLESEPQTGESFRGGS